MRLGWEVGMYYKKCVCVCMYRRCVWGWATGSACSSARYGIAAGGCWRKTCLATAVVSDPFPPQALRASLSESGRWGGLNGYCLCGVRIVNKRNGKEATKDFGMVLSIGKIEGYCIYILITP